MTSQTNWLAALKDQMFLLETERIQGKISEDDYLEQKTAFETMMRRALPQHASPVSQNEKGNEDIAFVD